VLVWAKALRRPGTIRRLLARHRFLIDRRSDLPHLRPREFLTPGTMPWLPRMPKVHLIYMRPPKAWPGDRAALALGAVWAAGLPFRAEDAAALKDYPAQAALAKASVWVENLVKGVLRRVL